MNTELLYGRRPVLESLRARRRTFQRLIVADNAEQSGIIQDILEAASQNNIKMETAHRRDLDSMVQNANHQSVILEAGPYPYVNLEQLLLAAEQHGEPPLILLLDLLQDVHNVGALMRTAEAVGVHGVVIQERRAAGVTPAVVSASAGAVEHLSVAQVTNFVRTMETFKESNVWLAGLDYQESAQRYDRANLRGALGIVVGSEGKGLRRLVRETCDFLIYLPMQGQIESLNATVAGSVALYAAWQARQFGGEKSPANSDHRA
ncbi:MAG: 23S rRNA (guanosine(2251)-2'-O)-methyltransferase RlmB [Anaerolineae bacterium]|nr:23S rRNA (guanosine(2251)-2'-O)-methyltransferase RlmB [Anaerolineae bacterium]